MGVVDVDAFLEAMPMRLLTEWMAFDQLEGFGSIRADYRTGFATATLAAAMTGNTKLTPAMFMPPGDHTQPPVPTADEIGRRLASMFGHDGKTEGTGHG